MGIEEAHTAAKQITLTASQTPGFIKHHPLRVIANTVSAGWLIPHLPACLLARCSRLKTLATLACLSPGEIQIRLQLRMILFGPSAHLSCTNLPYDHSPGTLTPEFCLIEGDRAELQGGCPAVQSTSSSSKNCTVKTSSEGTRAVLRGITQPIKSVEPSKVLNTAAERRFCHIFSAAMPCKSSRFLWYL